MSVQPFVNPYNVVTPLTPDMDAIFAQLQAKLTNDGAIERIWTDAITVATGSYIARMVASFIADATFTAERVQHEVMLHTARRPSSIYSVARNLGVHLQRKIPGGVLARLARADAAVALTIPAYTQVYIGGKAYFNRDAIVFAANISYLTVTLYRGTVQVEAAVSTGKANQAFIINQNKFAVSDVDVYVVDSNGVKWKRVTNGLWQYPSVSFVFQDNTEVDGAVRLEFGDGVYGRILPAGTFYIGYVLVQTSDYDASLDLNSVAISTPVQIAGFTEVAGLTIGEESSIQMEKNPTFYQRNAPYISSGQKHANTRDNYRGLALTYPGVIDARMMGQAEINPKDLRWMTGVATCLLTERKWGDADWNTFVMYMQNNSDSCRHFYRHDPQAVALDFDIHVEVEPRADIPALKATMQTALTNMFALTEGSLGAKYAKNLIGKRLADSAIDPYGALVTFLRIDTPVNDPVLRPNQYAVSGNVNITMVYDPSSTPKIVQGVTVPGGSIGLWG
jgi:hypothetical protein